MPDTNALTDDERAELEALRAEKAKREQAQAAAAERAELEALKAEAARTKSEAEHDRAIAEARERGRKNPRSCAEQARGDRSMPRNTTTPSLVFDCSRRHQLLRTLMADPHDLPNLPIWHTFVMQQAHSTDH